MRTHQDQQTKQRGVSSVSFPTTLTDGPGCNYSGKLRPLLVDRSNMAPRWALQLESASQFTTFSRMPRLVVCQWQQARGLCKRRIKWHEKGGYVEGGDGIMDKDKVNFKAWVVQPHCATTMMWW